MALIHNDVTVVGDKHRPRPFAIETLDDRNVNDPSWTSTAAAYLPNILDGQIQKCGEPLTPLVEKLTAMNQHRVLIFRCAISHAATTVLPKAVVALKIPSSWARRSVRCGLLVGAKLPVELHIDRLTGESLVIEFHRKHYGFEEPVDLAKTATGQGNVLWKFLRSNGSHAVCRTWKIASPVRDRIQGFEMRRAGAGDLASRTAILPFRHRSNYHELLATFGGNGPDIISSFFFRGWRQRPRIFGLLLVCNTAPNTDDVSAADELADRFFDFCERHPPDAR